MAECLDSYQFGPGPQPRYPYRSWADGRIWRLRPGDDFDCEPERFRELVYRWASRNHLSVLTRREPDGSVVVQFPPG